MVWVWFIDRYFNDLGLIQHADRAEDSTLTVSDMSQKKSHLASEREQGIFQDFSKHIPDVYHVWNIYKQFGLKFMIPCRFFHIPYMGSSMWVSPHIDIDEAVQGPRSGGGGFV